MDDGQVQEITRLRDLVPLGQGLQASDQIGGLPAEDDREHADGREHEQETRHRQHHGRHAAAAPELARETIVEGLEEKGQERRPHDGLDEGTQDLEESDGQEGGGGHPEDPQIELAIAVRHGSAPDTTGFPGAGQDVGAEGPGAAVS